MISVKYLRTLFYMIISHLFLYQCSQNCQDRFSVTEANESIDLENDLNNPKKEKSVIMQLKKETLPTLSQNSNLFANILNTKDFNKINAALMQNDKKAKDGAKDLAFKKIKNGKCTLEILLENVLGSNGEKNNKFLIHLKDQRQTLYLKLYWLNKLCLIAKYLMNC
jgi:hypothetical protein